MDTACCWMCVVVYVQSDAFCDMDMAARTSRSKLTLEQYGAKKETQPVSLD